MESTLKEEILDKFLQLSESISIIEDRCKNIQNVDDFLLSPWGMTVLDACIMRIQVIGETIKAIDDKTQRSFDYEIIWVVITKHLPPLKETVENIIKDLS